MEWEQLALSTAPPAEAWRAIFAEFARRAVSEDIEAFAAMGDRLVADAAWDLWRAWEMDDACHPLRTTERLWQDWEAAVSGIGVAVLILDALSLRELPCLLKAGEARGVRPEEVSVSGAGLPTTTDGFATSLGVGGRAKLRGGVPPGGFKLSGAWTEVFEGLPFEDCLKIPYEPRVFVWHDLVDARLHHAKTGTVLRQQVEPVLIGDGFWQMVARLRQGRRLIVTSDHGYATRSKAAVLQKPLADSVRGLLGGSRCVRVSQIAPSTVPPVILTAGQHHCLIGNRSWDVSGGFPEFSHGGASLLEVAVPYLTFGAV